MTKQIPVPATEEERAKKRRALARRGKTVNAFTLVFAALAVLTLIGAAIVLVVTEFQSGAARLCEILAGSFAGGAILFAGVAVFCGSFGKRYLAEELDFRERCDGEESFFVGEGTLATFCEKGLLIHSEDGKGEEITVPYADIRFFSVCTRRAPKEKGTWDVVFEIPAKYLVKKGKFQPNDPPALVQAEAKARLYETIRAHGLELTGSLPPEKAEKKGTEKKKFALLRKFIFPKKKARNAAAIMMVVGGLLAAGGIPVAIWLNASIGSVISVLGAVSLGRAILSYRAAKSVLAFYREGVFWGESNREESMFIKWEDVERVETSEQNGFPLLDFVCFYGPYHFPNPDGAYEFLRENFPEKCGGEGK